MRPSQPILRPKNKTGYFGVHYSRKTPGQRKSYVARIAHPPGQTLYLGRFSTAEQAAKRVAEALAVIGRKPWANPIRGRCRDGHVLLTPKDYSRNQCRRCRRDYDRRWYAHKKKAEGRP